MNALEFIVVVAMYTAIIVYLFNNTPRPRF